MPPRIKLLIADLGLRYRPTGTADLEAHASSLALLAIDVADLPPDRLERAIAAWVRAERWMPKASELVALCQKHQRNEIAGTTSARQSHDAAQTFCDQRNAELWSGRHPRKDATDLEWFVDAAGETKLRYKREAPALREPVPVDQIAGLNRGLRRFNAPFRFNARGFSFDLAPGAPDPTDPINGG